MAHIVCDADPFCYGPATTLLSIVKHLIAYGHQITVLAAGTALELIQREPRVTTIACDCSSVDAVTEAICMVGGADLFLSVLGDASVRAAVSLLIPVAYVDTLFWIWPSACEPHLRDADLYFIDDNFEAASNLRDSRLNIRNPFLVGPIIDTSYIDVHPSGNQLLVSLGGVDSYATVSGVNTRYHLIITDLLIRVLEKSNTFDRVLVTGGASAIADLEKHFTTETVEFVSLGHDAYLQELISSRLVLGIPGLAIPLEAFAYHVPILFLPPLNYSQVLQLRRFQSAAAADYALSWDDLIPDTAIQEGLNEEVGIAQVLSCIRCAEEDERIHARLLNGLEQMLLLNQDELKEVQHAQSSYFANLGSNGAPTIAQIISDYLRVSKESPEEAP